MSLALVLVSPTVAFAATTTGYNQTPPPPPKGTTTGYKQTPPPPTQTTTASKQTPSTPRAETTPAKQEVAPKQEETARRTMTRTTSTPSREVGPTATRARMSTLPFTGLDLRWVVFGGALLLGCGLSLMLALRKRQRADH